MVVWLDVHARVMLEARLDGVPIELAPMSVDGGVRLALEIPASARALVIDGVDPRWSAPLTFDFTRESVPSFLAEAEADAPGEAVARLRAGLDDADPFARLAAMQLLRRHLVALGDSEALAETEATAALAKRLGRDRDFADAAAAAAFLRLGVDDLVGARAWAQRLRELAELRAEVGSAEIPVWAHYQLGLLASRIGDYAAIEHLEKARRAARRVALEDEFVFASEMLGVAYAELGRGEEAAALIEEILGQAAELHDCKQRAELYANTGWASLLLAEAGFEHHDPIALFEAQVELIGPEGACPDPLSMSFARVNSALAAVADHEYDEAWDWIAPLTIEAPPSYLVPWVEEIVARIGVGAGRWELVPPLVARPAPDATEPGLRWNGLVRQGETLARLGLDDAAIAFLREAETTLERAVSSVGVSVGRELFLAGRQTSAQQLVELLVAQGDVAEALCHARLARGRALRPLARSRIALSPDAQRERDASLSQYLAIQVELAASQRQDWTFSAPERERRARLRTEREAEAGALLDQALRGADGSSSQRSLDPCDELPAIDPGHVLLVHFPRESGSWLFVADADAVDVIEAPDPGDGRWPADLLAGYEERIASAARIHVIPTGTGWSVDFGALRVGERVLLEVAPIIYSLDLHPHEHQARSRRAFVVANPSQDLANTREEAREVARQLAAQSWAVQLIVGAEVTRAALEAGLVEADLLHYAGHGVGGGPDGWHAALLLHDEDVLTVSDVLAQPRVPAGVILTGCDTTSAAPRTLAGGMNLGRAFVLAGADWVIGADGKVDDALARALGEALHTGTRASGSLDGPAALREAQLVLRERDPHGAWHAFRAVGL